MKIKMLVCWYDRKPDFTPDYSKDHHGSFVGDTPSEVMKQYRAFERDHDLAKYTRLEIVGIY